MLAILSLLLAQTPSPPPPQPQEIVRPQEVRSLPGQLDAVPVFNSNSPELIGTEGILLSTFPPDGKQYPGAHLNFPLQGRFDVFAHHVFRALSPEDLRSVYLGVIAYNPGTEPVTIDVLQAASYLSQPDAPFIELPTSVDNPDGTVYAGPGSRVMSDVLRGQRQDLFPPVIVIPPQDYGLLLNLPIPGPCRAGREPGGPGRAHRGGCGRLSSRRPHAAGWTWAAFAATSASYACSTRSPMPCW